MAKVPMNNVLYLTRRFSSVAETENIRSASSQTMRKVSDFASDVKSESSMEQKQSFWMRHPNKGYWIPENSFGDIDPAELREKLLPKK